MRNFQGYFSRTFQVLEFSRKNPGLSRRRGNTGLTDMTDQQLILETQKQFKHQY